MKFKAGLLFFLCFSASFLFGQTQEQIKQITSSYDKAKLQSLSQEFNQQFIQHKAFAQKMAAILNLPLIIEEDGKYKELQKVLPNGTPIYYTTFNLDAARSTRTNHLQNGGSLGLNLMGLNMTARIWDAGIARITHQEYDGAGGNNRYSVGDGTTLRHPHSAHVAGTIMASGVVAQAKGMAPYGKAIGYDWNNDLGEATTAANNGMLISSHSYGIDASQFDPSDMYLFGAYISESRAWDNLLFNAPYYLMVAAAGNDGQAPYNTQPLDGMNGYDKLTGHSTSKNTLVIANAQDANVDSAGNLIGVNINVTSSQGPTDDYRIKPDLTGNGTGVYSTVQNADNAYGTMTGTSMATPNVSGSLLLLQELYNRENSNFMRAATLKGLVLHTADDAGPAGPDVVWGWGLMNAKKAAETIIQKDAQSIINELPISNGQTLSLSVDSDGINPLLASISWTDRPGVVNNSLNSHTPALVNDLDIRITKGATTYTPWKLTGVTTNSKGDNNVDPFERVDIIGASGTYTITITHKGSLTGGSQNFSLIVTGIVTAACPLSVVSADLISDPICNSGTADISVSGNSGTTEIRLYSVALGGSPVAVINGSSGTFTTPVINQTTTFYVAAANSSCESARYPVVVNVSSAPPAISITKTDYPAGGNDCNFDYSELTASGGKISNIQVYDDDLSTSTWGLQSTNTSRIAAAFLNSNNAGGSAPEIAIYRVGSANDPNSECMVFPLVGGSDLALNISGYTELNFQFKHNFRYRNRANSSRNIYLAVSTDGTNYNIVWTRTNITGNINSEIINVDLNAYLGGTVMYFMFGYYGDSAAFEYWYFDDIKITAGKQAPITWSPTNGLYQDQALTIPYSGDPAFTVYAVPSGTQDYTASASYSPGSCAATDMVQVTNHTASFIANTGNWDEPLNWQTQTLPDITKCVKVPNGKTLTVNVENAEAKNITVNPGGKVIIQADKALTVDDFIKNDSGVDNFIIESAGSLVQNNDNAVNTGQITVKRNFKFSTERKQYNFIISPVVGQKIKFIYSNPPFVIYHKEETNFFYNAFDGNYIAGRGLAIKEPPVASVPASTIDAMMKGEPFNGVLNYPLKYTTADPEVIHGVNLVGNPYPSNLDLKQLYEDNNIKIGSTIEFWDNRGNVLFVQEGSEYQGFNFAKYNAASDTGNPAPTNVNNPDKRIPNKYARPATAFYVYAQSTSNGLTIDFKNQYRSATANLAPEFFGKENLNTPTPDRFWLTLTTPGGLDITTAITYFEGGTDAYSIDDSEAYEMLDNIYSLVDDHQLSIQGRKPFVETDVLPLGVRLDNMGTYLISIFKAEGVFSESQHIFIHDKVLGLVHDLTERPYKFVSRKGEYNNRFEIIYHPSDPGLSFENQNRITIEKINHNIVITSSIDPISEIEIFDIHSRSVYKKTGISSNEHKVAANLFNHQIIVVTVKTETGEIMTKKFVNK